MPDTSRFLPFARNTLLLAISAFALSAAPSVAYADDDDDDDCYEIAVESINFVEIDLYGKAELCVNNSSLEGKVKLKGLTQGNAYTAWWVYIDQPACDYDGFLSCISTFFGDDPLAVFGRMDSAVGTAKGKTKFKDKLRGMRVSSGSQVWILVFGHGMASTDGRQLARQLLTPEDPNAGAPHLGVNAYGYPVAIAAFDMP